MLRRPSSTSSASLLAQRNARLAALQDPFHHVADLRHLVGHRGEHRARAAGARGAQVLLVPRAGGRERDHRVGRVQDRRRRTVVVLKGDQRRGRVVLAREGQDVVDARGAEAVDRLRVVAHHGDAAAVRLHEAQDLGLQRVGVLVLVAQHVVEAASHAPRQRCVATEVKPVEEQMLVVEHGARRLGVDVGGE